MERTREHEKYASAKVSQKGGPFFSRGVASRRRRRRRRHGREEWCDLSFQKVQLASDFLHFEAHLRNGSWSPRGPVVGLDGRRIVASLRTWSRGMVRPVFQKISICH